MAIANKVCCSFCGEDQTKVSNLIAGRNGVYICNTCIDICTQTLPSTSKPTQPRFEIVEQQMLCVVLQNFDSKIIDDMKLWLVENEIPTWHKDADTNVFADSYQIMFENESDLVAFKLRWI